MLLLKPLDDPPKTTYIILEALKDTGQRGIIDRGWGDLGNCKCCFNIILCFCHPQFFFFGHQIKNNNNTMLCKNVPFML